MGVFVWHALMPPAESVINTNPLALNHHLKGLGHKTKSDSHISCRNVGVDYCQQENEFLFVQVKLFHSLSACMCLFNILP